MVSIDKEDVARVAKLARVQLSETELDRATADLQAVLSHFATVQSISTTNVPTSDDVTGLHNVVRSDEAQSPHIASADALLEAAPETAQRQIKVKAVFS